MFFFNTLSRANIVQILQKLDYVSFARIQQSCKDVSSLVTDSPQLYSVRVVDNIVIDYHEADGKYSWVVGKHEEWSDRGTPKYCIDSALIINMTEVEKGTLETEQLAAALQGMHWRKVKLATHAHSTLSGRGTLNFASNQSEKIGGVVEALKRIFKACVPKCDILTSDHSTVKVLDIAKRLCNPEAVHITHHSFSFPDINIALQGVKQINMKHGNHTMDGLADFCVDRRRVKVGGTLSSADWSELNRVLKMWYNGQSSMEYLKLSVNVPMGPESIVDSVETIPFVNGKMKHFAHTKYSRSRYGGEIGTDSPFEMTSWFIRCRKNEDDYPVYALLTYEHSENQNNTSTIITFQKLPRSPSCECDNPICSETLALIFPYLVDGCYPIVLGPLLQELLERPAVGCLGMVFTLYIHRQLTYLSTKRRGDFEY